MQEKPSVMNLLDGSPLRMADTRQLDRRTTQSWPPERGYIPPPPDAKRRPVFAVFVLLAVASWLTYHHFFL
jgi:hypothetical protein